MNEQREALEAELRCLTSDLYYGEYGDWKLAKICEYIMRGDTAPYDLDELHAKRQEMRDRINEIKALLADGE